MVSMDQGFVEKVSSRQKLKEIISMDWEAVEVLSRRNLEISMDRECVEDLLRRKRGQKKSSMYWPDVENLSRAKQRGSIEKDVSRYFSRSCRP